MALPNKQNGPWPRFLEMDGAHEWKRASLKDGPLASEFQKWLKTAMATATGHQITAELSRYKHHNPSQFPAFEEAILFAVWCAHKFDNWGPSPWEAGLAAWRGNKRLADYQGNMLHRIERDWRRRPDYFNEVINEVVDELVPFHNSDPYGLFHARGASITRQDFIVLIHDFLELYEKRIAYFEYREDDVGGSTLRRFSACFQFPAPKLSNRTQTNEAEWGLALELGIRLFQWKHQASGLPTPIDIDGLTPAIVARPDYKLITLLVHMSAGSGARSLQPQAQQVLRRRIRNYFSATKRDNPAVQFVGWPIHI